MSSHVSADNPGIALLNALYQAALTGIPRVSRSVDDLAEDYLARHSNVRRAAKDLIRRQIAKCGASGFLTGMGGAITLPVTVPANVSSVLYVQMRMVAAVARMGGFDLRSDQVQTMVYVCLTGTAAANVFKSAGIEVGKRFAEEAVKQIPAKTLNAVNRKVGFRLLAKAGGKGVVQLGRMIPLIGGAIGGTVDTLSAKVIGNNAYRLFIKKKSW